MIFKRTLKMSLFGLCSGIISGLAAITPACGHVTPASSLAFGALAGCFCCVTSELKNLILKKYDDVCDVFAVHGVGGVVSFFFK
jgi:Amt family ammonium transporter